MVYVIRELLFDAFLFKLFMEGCAMFAVPVSDSLLQTGIKADNVV